MSGNGLTYTYTKGISAGVCVMATVGVLSALTTFLLILHLVHVAFIPTASNLRYLLSRAQTIAEPETPRVRVTRTSSASPGDRKLTNDPPITPINVSQRHGQGRGQTLHLQDNRMAKERMFLPMQLGLFIICLLISDLIQALGVLIQLRWLHLGGIQDGRACWVQASLITFGDVASGIWNGIIAIHTFATVCFGKRMSAFYVIITTICGWTIPALMNIIGSTVLENKSTRGHYYGVAGAWCFITNAYDVERAVLHYAPMLVAAGIITLMYIPVFLTIRGNLLITPSQSDWSGYRFTFRATPTPINAGSTLSGGSSHSTHLRGIAKKMLWYPIVYMALLLPTVVCRFKGIYGTPVPLPVILGCISLLSAMGISNVLIYMFTRNLGGTPWFARPLLGRQADVEIFVERTTINEEPSAPLGDNGRIQNSIKSLPTPLHLDILSIPPHHPDFSLDGDLYPDIGAKVKEAGVDEPPSPTSKHVLLHDLIFEHPPPPRTGSPNSGHEGNRVEGVGV